MIFDEDFTKEQRKAASKALSEKVLSQYKAFSFICNGCSPAELALLVGILMKRNCSDPKNAYKQFNIILTDFMKSNVYGKKI